VVNFNHNNITFNRKGEAMLDWQKIKRLRRKQGKTQDELSKLAEITINTISNIENGHRPRIAMNTLDNLAKALGVKPHQLMK